ncbi:alpha-N-acetylgalactosaminide alpha-2,6-sialyltransferase 1-like [Gouania willdenowi]|uniref:alpha-N-acetylgalactosaminide alpha-2,6-sialyltransferase 1-like n=1 Tax=Gouania willdenowi TaxID=441366 RepID=UPI001056D08F|nr:alpha-N-acetylgalactosaminide alpha-2,6-sialyltransferase 1-like [Gouania willdenowi]
MSPDTSQGKESGSKVLDERGRHSTTSHPDPTTSKKTTDTSQQTPDTPMPILYKKNFTAYPQWDFENVYSLKSSPWPTTCARSLRHSKDETFRKDFLPNSRLFLQKDDLNMSEWNRLSHFTGPFGFMQNEYKEVMASVKLIPKPKEPLLHPKAGGDGCVTCAVVGTGGILYGSKMGEEIDAHDYVFRMNGAVIKGFEEDVGRRTSVYVHTSYAIVYSVKKLAQHGFTSAPHDEGIKYVMIPEGMRDHYWIEALLKGNRVSAGEFINYEPQKYYPTPFNQSNFYVLHPDFLRYLRNRFIMSETLKTKHWWLFRPTNGAFTLLLALHTCDTVDAYGFMTNDYAKYSNYYVEKFQKTNVIFYINHDLNVEKDLWHRLHDSKIIKLFQRN